jgi:hypothetical protein
MSEQSKWWGLAMAATQARPDPTTRAVGAVNGPDNDLTRGPTSLDTSAQPAAIV